jgi:hypothetical protein
LYPVKQHQPQQKQKGQRDVNSNPSLNKMQDYPDCNVLLPWWIGNGECHGGDYNTVECGFDGGDCEDFNNKYPNCNVSSPSFIGNGNCNGGDYNTPECGFDKGDCEDFNAKMKNYPNCTNVDYSGDYIGDGYCNGGDYNTVECGFDGGDCEDFNNKYPNCNVEYSGVIGNGYCNYGIYNTVECGFDGGDCEDFNNKYPNCNVANPRWIGDGSCFNDVDYNTAACGFDGGDCDSFNRVINKYPDCSTANYLPWRIGDGECHGEYNTAECGFDDGDCGNPNSFPVGPVVGGVAGVAFLFIAIGIVNCKISKRNAITKHLQEVVAGGGVQTGNAKDDMNNPQEERFPDVEATGSSARNIHKPVLQSQDWKSGEAM